MITPLTDISDRPGDGWIRRIERPREFEVTDVGAGQLGDRLP